MDRAELYALPPDRFVAERNALAKELRQAGRRDEAGEVAALRKPSVAARAVNRLAREHSDALDDLLAAGDELIDVQARVVAGDADRRDLTQAAERERSAVARLVATARELLADDGQGASPTVVDRVSETLHAAALDPDARPPVQEGRLERELRHVGFWTGGGEATPAARSTTPSRAGAKAKAGAKTKAGAKAKAGSRAKDEAEAEARAARQREEARKDARTAVTEARRASARADKARDGAERRRARAAEALQNAEREDREAEEALTAASSEAEEAADARAAAERELEALSDD